MIPHLKHNEFMVVVVAAGAYMSVWIKTQRLKNTKTVTAWFARGLSTWGLTSAGLNALKPPVTSVSAAGTSTVLEPSTTRSATTRFAGFLEGAAR